MYSKEEASRLKQQFWITFGKYLKPIPSADGLPVNWVNYKTGVKNLYFRMNAEQFEASIALEFTHPDEMIRQIYFEQLLAYKVILDGYLQEEWEWEPVAENHGVAVCKVGKTISGLSVYKQSDWPAIISFLKPRIIALDEFWADVKPVFEALG